MTAREEYKFGKNAFENYVSRHLFCHRTVEVAPLAWSRPVWCVTYQCDPSNSRSSISYVTYTLGVS